MSKFLRSCGGGTTAFVTGVAKCPITPQYIKALIFVEHGKKLPANLTADTLEAACHADYPDRIYPLAGIVEYAPSGGEIQTSQNGYGPNTVTGYSETSDQFTMGNSDVQLRASVIANMNHQFDVYYVDDNNIIFGVQDEKDGEFPLKGFPLNGIGLGGSKFKTSSQAAYDLITLYSKDYANNEKMLMAVPADFQIIQVLADSGIRLVEWVKDGANWILVDKYSRSDVSNYYAAALAQNVTTCIPNATSCSYANGVFTIALKNSDTKPQLAAPSVLQANGIVGIQQA